MKPLITAFQYKTIDEYIGLGGYEGLRTVIATDPKATIDAIKTADIRGRGGAGFPTWKKWLMAKDRTGRKVVLCNADEGEPGSFKDRDLLMKDPYKVIEGMSIAAYCTGSSEGFIYIREEYGHIKNKFIECCESAKAKGFLGNHILGTDFSFDIQVNTGAGAYICGENSALIESMHGKAGRPRLKIPRVGERGLFNLPTLVNNVETFSCVATLMIVGTERYCQTGTPQSIGNKVLSLSGKINKPGTYEIPFGTPLKTLLYDLGGGPKAGHEIKFVQSGGASGPLIPSEAFDLNYSYEDFESKGFSIGAGSIVVVDDSMPLVDYLLAIEGFFKHESCGKCTPCREGLPHIVRILKKIKAKTATVGDIDKLKRTAKVMVEASFCGLGVTAPTALYSAFKYYEDELFKDVIGWEANLD